MRFFLLILLCLFYLQFHLGECNEVLPEFDNGGSKQQFVIAKGPLVEIDELKPLLSKIIDDKLESLQAFSHAFKLIKLDTHLEVLAKQFTKFQESSSRLAIASTATKEREEQLHTLINGFGNHFLKMEQSLQSVQERIDREMRLMQEKYDSMLVKVTAAATKTEEMVAKSSEALKQLDLLDESVENVEKEVKSMRGDVQENTIILTQAIDEVKNLGDGIKNTINSTSNKEIFAIKENSAYLQHQIGLLTGDHSLTIRSIMELFNLTATCNNGATGQDDVLQLNASTATIENIGNAMTQDIKKHIEDVCGVKHQPAPASNCAELQNNGQNVSGVYAIHPTTCHKGYKTMVYCDFETDGGGWTVIQRRDDVLPKISFFRDWAEYKWGFGELSKEFWLGLEPIHLLSYDEDVTLRVDMEDFDGNVTYALYDRFKVNAEHDDYKLYVDGYSGTAGDSLIYHTGQKFTTKDRDLDEYPTANCALLYKGGWWYKACHLSNLNGLYQRGKHDSYADGINWNSLGGYHYSFKKVEMRIRPTQFTPISMLQK